MKTLIKNVQAVINPLGCARRVESPTELDLIATSVLIENGKIVDFDPAAQIVVDEVYDGQNCFLLPGVVDDQVHFREPGLTTKEDLQHASQACAAGGITSFLEMPNTIPNVTNQSRLNDKLALAAAKSLVNYGFYIGASCDNLDDLKYAERTPGIKIFIGSSTGDLLVDDQAVLEKIFAETRLPICAHCEDETTVRQNAARFANSTDVADHSRIRDVQAATIATARAIDLATRHQHPFHILHVSTAAEIPLLVAAPPWVTAEVCPHHLFFNTDDYARLGSLIKMNPSIKSADDNRQLWQALIDGTISVIATDHAPHTLAEKELPFPQCPSGLPAVENSLALMLDQVNRGNCTLQQVVFWMASEPARIWNMKSKGELAIGADADLVLVDLSRKRTILNQNQLTKSGWSPWHGTELTGWPIATWVGGTLVFQQPDPASPPELLKSHRGREIQFTPSD